MKRGSSGVKTMVKPKGWRGEPIRHAKAVAKGLRRRYERSIGRDAQIKARSIRKGNVRAKKRQGDSRYSRYRGGYI